MEANTMTMHNLLGSKRPTIFHITHNTDYTTITLMLQQIHGRADTAAQLRAVSECRQTSRVGE